jgi:predicted ferric reductase
MFMVPAADNEQYSGVPAYAFGFFLVAFSFPFIRRRFYETFVFSHIVGAITFFGLCFWHFTNELDSWYYLYGALAVWLIQLAGRAFWKTSAFKVTDTWLEGLPTVAHRLPGGLAKLEVFVPDTWTWKPGQHVFLRFPHLNPLDNHPFTIASIPNRQTVSEKSSGNVMRFLVRAHNGSTKKLLSWLEKVPDAKLSTIVDGPYGTVGRCYENCAEEIILVAGGNGISACLPYLQHLSKAMQHESCVTKRVRLIWMVRHHDHVAWVAEELHEAINDAPVDSIAVDVHVTEGGLKDAVSPKESDDDKIEPKVATGSSVSSSIEIDGLRKHYDGRPNLLQRIPQLVGAKRTTIIGCGPESLKIDLSNTVAKLQARVLKGKAEDVSLHTETFDC